MSEHKRIDGRKAGVSAATILGVFFVALLMLSTNTLKIKQDEKSWHILWEGSLAEATEADPGAGKSGFLEIFFMNHSADPANAYNDNVSADFETWCNASLDDDGTGTVHYAYADHDSFNLYIKHTTLFDIVVRARWNATHAWDGSQWIGSDCRINITCTGGVTIAGTVSGTNCISNNDTAHTYIWINVYWNNAGAGYSLAKNGVITVSSISIQAKY